MKLRNKMISALSALSIACAVIPSAGMANDTSTDLSEIYGSNYIIQTCESGESRPNAYEEFGQWTQSGSGVGDLLKADSVEDSDGNTIKKVEFTSNRQFYGTYPVSEAAWKDLSGYNYISFRYKGDGQERNFTFVFKGPEKSIELNIPADTEWHTYCASISSWNTKTLTGMNVKFDEKDYGTVYFDDIAFSTDIPSFADIEEPEETDEPTGTPTAAPTMDPGPSSIPQPSELNEIYGDSFIIQTVEENESRGGAYSEFGQWEYNTMNMGREDDAVHGKVRVAEYQEGTLNYKRYAINQDAWRNISGYNYLSFWYKGDGSANSFVFVFKAGNKELRRVNVNVPADENWYFYCESLDSWTGTTDMDYMNIQLNNQGRIYFDDIAFSVEKPDIESSEITPTTSPETTSSPEVTTSPEPIVTPKPVIDGKAGFIDTNEDNEAGFIDWRTSDNFKEERSSDPDNQRSGQVRRLTPSGKNKYGTNYFYVYDNGEKKTTSTSGVTIDFTPYKYLGFWYKGTGEANTLTLAIKNGTKTVMRPVVSIEAGDTSWHYEEIEIASNIYEGAQLSDFSTVKSINVSLAESNVVYLDDLGVYNYDTPDYEITDFKTDSDVENGQIISGNYTVTANIKRNTNLTNPVTFIVVAYDENNFVSGVSFETIDMTEESKNVELSLNINGNNNTVKFMLWDSMSSMIPLI